MSAPRHLDFALGLERAMREAGLSAPELARRAGVAERTLRRYRSGERLPDPLTVASLEAACGVAPGTLTVATTTEPAGAPPPDALPGGAAASLDATGPDRPRSEPAVSGVPSGPVAMGADGAVAPGSRRRARRWIAVAAAITAVALVGLVGLLWPRADEARAPVDPLARTLAAARDLPASHRERTGSPARTWSDPRIAGGRPGPPLRTEQTVTVVCRFSGFVVESGNRWWYLLGSAPHDRRFFATADAFYNVADTRGLDFRKTRFVDPAVPICPRG